jgi:hypothetical protein
LGQAAQNPHAISEVLARFDLAEFKLNPSLSGQAVTFTATVAVSRRGLSMSLSAGQAREARYPFQRTV